MINLHQEEKKVRIKKRDTYEAVYILYKGRGLALNA